MSKSLSVIDPIGFWSIQKLDILGKYLAAYARILGRERWCQGFYYIDAFTGTITPQDKDTMAYLAGSPLRALETIPSFTKYWFIEKDVKRYRRAVQLINDYPERTVEVLHGDCNVELKNTIIPILSRNKSLRAIVFLDPYGLQVQWDTVLALEATKQCDVFINFPIMAITRNLPKDRAPDDNAFQKICQVFGDSTWCKGFYNVESQTTLLGEQSTITTRCTGISEVLVERYVTRLASLFPYVTQPIIMENSTQAPLYALILASQKKLAEKIMTDIFSKATKEKKCSRRHKTNPGQGSLF